MVDAFTAVVLQTSSYAVGQRSKSCKLFPRLCCSWYIQPFPHLPSLNAKPYFISAFKKKWEKAESNLICAGGAHHWWPLVVGVGWKKMAAAAAADSVTCHFHSVPLYHCTTTVYHFSNYHSGTVTLYHLATSTICPLYHHPTTIDCHHATAITENQTHIL